MESDERINNLQKTVQNLCSKHLTERTQDLSSNEKRLLQAIFGDPSELLIEMKEKLNKYKYMILKIFEFVNHLEYQHNKDISGQSGIYNEGLI